VASKGASLHALLERTWGIARADGEGCVSRCAVFGSKLQRITLAGTEQQSVAGARRMVQDSQGRTIPKPGASIGCKS